MARIVILGAGIGGVPMAYEMKEMVKTQHDVTVISDSPTFHFVPSNPWVPPKWRKPEELKIELAPIMQKKASSLSRRRQQRWIRKKIRCNSMMVRLSTMIF